MRSEAPVGFAQPEVEQFKRAAQPQSLGVQLSNQEGDSAKNLPVAHAVLQNISQLEQGKAYLSENQRQSLRNSALRESMAEKSPETMKSATSMNAAQVIAGPKPWSKEWVFRGDEDQNPNLQSLVQLLSSETTQAQSKPEHANKVPPKGSETGMSNPVSVENILKLNARNDTVATEQEMRRSETREIVPNRGIDELIRRLDSSPVLPNSALSGGEFVDTLKSISTGKQTPHSISGRLQNSQGKSLKISGDEPLEDAEPRFQVIEGDQTKIQGKPESLPGKQESLPGFQSKLSPKFSREQGAGVDSNLAINGIASAGSSFAERLQNSPRVDVLKAEVTGHVVKGSMAQDRLSTEALLGMSARIRDMSGQGGGEIRVRLKPENLGELNLHVVTHGKDVGLRIQASDEGAKKVLEESLSHLKESLANQNLTLAKVELSVASASSPANGSNLNDANQSQFQQHQAFNQLMGQNSDRSDRRSQEQGGQGHAWSNSDSPSGMRMAQAPQSRTSRTAGSGRLDVMA